MKTSRVLTLAATLQHVAVKVRGGVLNVTINRPGARNALNRVAHRELDQLFEAFAADAALRVAVIRGAGDKAFSSGSDLKQKPSTSSDDYADSGVAGLTHRFDLDKPVLAAVNGHALGGGLEIVLACDLAVAVDHAEFGFPAPLVGLPALGRGIHRLVRQVPYKPAMDLLLTGRRIDAGTALRLGLVNGVVPASIFEDVVDRWVWRVLRCAPLALGATKQVPASASRKPRSPQRSGGTPRLSQPCSRAAMHSRAPGPSWRNAQMTGQADSGGPLTD